MRGASFGQLIMSLKESCKSVAKSWQAHHLSKIFAKQHGGNQTHTNASPIRSMHDIVGTVHKMFFGHWLSHLLQLLKR